MKVSVFINFLLFAVAATAQENSWAVHLINRRENRPFSAQEADEYAAQLGLENYGPVGGLEGYYLFGHESRNLQKRALVEDELMERDHVNWFEFQEPVVRTKRSVVPEIVRLNDPQFKDQWHLLNDGMNSINRGNDINVVGAWNRGYNGTGITVSVIDDGLDYLHPDLQPNYSNVSSFDFKKRVADPKPQNSNDVHGTRCAGEIAAAANTVCGVGVAFGAKVAGERLIGDGITDALEAQALNFAWEINDVYSSSWGPSDDGKSVDGPGRLAKRALVEGVSRGRDGKGSIFVFASGNGGDNQDNCNFDGFANSVYTISIGAINHEDKLPNYSEECAAHLAVTYSGGKGKSITTTDISGGCTDRHSGTSAAAPLASGMIALMLSARPDLGWRDVQQIIVETAVKNDPLDPDWITNGANRHVSHKYGFGKLDASALVDQALKHKLLPHPSLQWSKSLNPSVQIPLSGNSGVFESKISVSASELATVGLSSLEHVQVTIRLSHPERRQLKITLISPDGTPSVLATRRVKDDSRQGFNPWTFMTVRNWGEKGVGDWILQIQDSRETNPLIDEGLIYELGTLISWELSLHGTCSEVSEISTSEGLRPVCKQTFNRLTGSTTTTTVGSSSSSSGTTVVGWIGVFIGSSFLSMALYAVYRAIRDRNARGYKRAGLGTRYDLESPQPDSPPSFIKLERSQKNPLLGKFMQKMKPAEIQKSQSAESLLVADPDKLKDKRLASKTVSNPRLTATSAAGSTQGMIRSVSAERFDGSSNKKQNSLKIVTFNNNFKSKESPI